MAKYRHVRYLTSMSIQLPFRVPDLVVESKTFSLVLEDDEPQAKEIHNETAK